jgi:para-nitrobenzyl esterase
VEAVDRQTWFKQRMTSRRNQEGLAENVADRPSVELSQGRCAGRWESGLAVFRGIPYAAPPFGGNRFLPPQPVKPWSGVLDAGTFAPPAPQAPRDFETNPQVVGGENCLALNIWSGAFKDEQKGEEKSERRPVMVWVPGGGFMRGSASDPLYDGASFAHQGVVFVSFNYRLGVDGFMSLPDTVANRGLLDQVAALQWVKNNIEAFGGDPSCITVFGVSAGAGALANLLGMPRCRGLFQRVILQSPSVSCQMPAEADSAAQAIASLLDVKATQQGLASVSLGKTVQTVARLAANYALRQKMGLSDRNFFPLRPVIDGTIVTDFPIVSMQREWQEQAGLALDVMVGANAEEMRFYLVPNGEIDRIDMDRIQTFMAASGLSNEMYEKYARDRPNSSLGEHFCAMQSDYYYRVPAQQIAKTACTHGLRVLEYEFAWPSPQYGGRLGAAHALELPFVFNTLSSPQGLEFTGPNPPQTLATRMHRSWVEFAKSGQVDDWPATSISRPAVMRFDLVSTVVQAGRS